MARDAKGKATRRAGTARLIALLLALTLAGPVLADDGGGGAGGGGGGGGAGGGGGGGGAGGGGGPGGGDGGGGSGVSGAGVGPFDLGPNPGTNPFRDAGRVVRAILGLGSAPPAAVTPPPSPPPRAPAPTPTELLAWRLSPEALARARAEGFVTLAERRTADGSLLVRLRAPARLGPQQAAARLQALAPGAVVDRNPLYRPATTSPVGSGIPAGPPDLAEATLPAAAGCAFRGAVALIDTAVEPRHAGLSSVTLERETLRGPGRRASRPAHGTAVALRLAAQMPGARLVALDAFHLAPDGTDTADAFDIAAALDRAAALQVAVANLSFAGPANAVVEQIGADAARRGVLMVAAAGNEGPRAPPRYPAGYPWAIAVTAVQADGRPWPKSPVGRHIAFAAHGVEIALPGLAGRPPRRWSGTSFAAPVVTAAALLDPVREAAIGAAPAEAAWIGRLAARARDQGAPGRDPVFGWGLLDAPGCRPGELLASP